MPEDPCDISGLPTAFDLDTYVCTQLPDTQPCVCKYNSSLSIDTYLPALQTYTAPHHRVDVRVFATTSSGDPSQKEHSDPALAAGFP